MEADLYSGKSMGAKTTFPGYTEPCILDDGISLQAQLQT